MNEELKIDVENSFTISVSENNIFFHINFDLWEEETPSRNNDVDWVLLSGEIHYETTKDSKKYDNMVEFGETEEQIIVEVKKTSVNYKFENLVAKDKHSDNTTTEITSVKDFYSIPSPIVPSNSSLWIGVGIVSGLGTLFIGYVVYRLLRKRKFK